jgi:hypothetical protein
MDSFQNLKSWPMNMGTWKAISLEDMMVVVVSTNDHSISIMKEKPHTEKRKKTSPMKVILCHVAE